MMGMAYDWYNIQLSNSPSNQQEYFKDGLQALIDKQFYNASDIYTIEEELTKGTLTFTETDVRINHAIDATTNEKLGDDFKSIIFKDLNHPRGMGYRYSFDDNIWICINTDNYKFVTASAVIRRCNNTLNFSVNNVAVEEPCVIDYKLRQYDIDYNMDIDIPRGDILVTAQYNDTTRTIGVNKHFLFGGQNFKVKAVNNYLRNKTSDETSIPLIKFVMKLDQVKSGIDDTTNNIADNTTTFPWD